MKHALASISTLAMLLGSVACAPHVDGTATGDDAVHVEVASPAKAVVIPRSVLEAFHKTDDSSWHVPEDGLPAEDLVLQITSHPVYSCKSPARPIPACGVAAWQISIDLEPSELRRGRLDLAAPGRQVTIVYQGAYDGFDDCGGGFGDLHQGTLVLDEVGVDGVLFHLAGTNDEAPPDNGSGPGAPVESDGGYGALRCD
jgi:hypothetical protein